MLGLGILTIVFYVRTAYSFSCKDQNGTDVDWFMALKMPKNSDNSIPGTAEGHGFYYLDFNNKKFAESTYSLGENNQAIAYTLQQLYDNKEDPDVFYTMYNDEPVKSSSLLDILKSRVQFSSSKADAKTVQYGHTKGVLLFDKTQGFWLVHSVPLFPLPDQYAYPDSGTTYGQNLLCMTLNYDQLANIGIQLYYNHPNTYLTSLPTDFATENPELALAVAHKYKSGEPTSSVIELHTAKGLVFKSFAKSHEFQADLYEQLVAPTLAVGLNVETWKRGYEIDLTCPPATYPVFDVQYVQVLKSAEYKYTSDHSKYAVSRNFALPYVCNGDINRMTSQFKRGGGTICFLDDFVWGEYKSFFVSLNSCDS